MARAHLSESGRILPADPSGDALEAVLGDLVALLGSAQARAAGIAGRPPLGVRAVEVVPGEIRLLCAFDGPAFLCLAEDGTPATDARHVHETATASLAWEHVEAIVDAGRLQDLASAAGRVLALTDGPAAMVAAIGALVEALGPLAAWRAHPLRAVASIPQMDVAAALQDGAYRAYGMFVAASDHLVEVQDTLDADLVAALRAFEQAGSGAGVGERLADTVGRLVISCDDAAAEFVTAHVTPLRP